MSYTIVPEIIVCAAIAAVIVIVLRTLPRTKNLPDEPERGSKKSDRPRSIIFKLKSKNFARKEGADTGRVLDWRGLIQRGIWALKGLGRRPHAPEKEAAERVVEARREIAKKVAAEKIAPPVAARPKMSMAEQSRVRDLGWEARKAVKKGEFTAAEKHYRAMLDLDQENIDAYKGLGSVYTELNKYASAADAYRQAVRLGGREESVYLALSETLLRLCDWRAAIETLEHLVKINPQSAQAYALLGRAYTGLKLHKEALKYFEQAVKFAPRHTGYRLRLAEAAERRGQDVEAKMHLNKVLEIDPQNEAAKERLQKLLSE
jgi:tetratricopeptide (TPR) repeat protein